MAGNSNKKWTIYIGLIKDCFVVYSHRKIAPVTLYRKAETDYPTIEICTEIVPGQEREQHRRTKPMTIWKFSRKLQLSQADDVSTRELLLTIGRGEEEVREGKKKRTEGRRKKNRRRRWRQMQWTWDRFERRQRRTNWLCNMKLLERGGKLEVKGNGKEGWIDNTGIYYRAIITTRT